MKIQSSLVFDKHSNELIGFVDLGDDDVNVTAFGSRSVIASHVLAFIIREVASDLKYILGYFSTENVTSYQLMAFFWKAVSVLELGCNGSVLQSVMGLHQTESFICYMLVLLGKSTTVKLYIEQLTSLL